MTSPRLVSTRTPKKPAGLVVVLHGGAARQDRPMVSPTQLSVLRMVPIARRIARSARGELAVFRLLNSARGWDAQHTPVRDAQWALQQLREPYGDLPIALVGHSLGGRAALLAGGTQHVRSVVALNPWLTTGEEADLAGRRVLIVHGTDDRIASPSRSLQAARALAPRTSSLGYLSIRGGRHAMLGRARAFETAAADFVTATLLGRHVSAPVSHLLDGTHELEV